MKKIVIVDLFCGAGGETTGIMQSCKTLGLGNNNVELLAINHWDVAIETHSKNHSDAHHLCESIQNIDPRRHIPGGRVHLLWASPECTHFSNARGGTPKSDQSRASAWLILKWCSDLYVDELIVENVREFLDWGPLGADMKPLVNRRGETFAAWVRALESLGYKVEWRILNAADYGAPTTRQRLFVRASRKRKIVWPQSTHAKQPNLFVSKAWKPARDIVDWSIQSKSIIDRHKPLAENTLRRIEAGIRKFWGRYAEPFIVVLRGTAGVKSLALPLPTVTCSGAHYGLVEPIILHQMSGIDCVSIEKPLPTVTCRSSHHLIEPFIFKYYGAETTPESIDKPLSTVTCRDRFALVQGVPHKIDIKFRMFQPHELAAAQGFPPDYHFVGNRSNIVRQIGNAVPPAFAKALSMPILSDFVALPGRRKA